MSCKVVPLSLTSSLLVKLEKLQVKQRPLWPHRASAPRLLVVCRLLFALSRGATLPPEVSLSIAASLTPYLSQGNAVHAVIYELAAGATVAYRGMLSTGE